MSKKPFTPTPPVAVKSVLCADRDNAYHPLHKAERAKGNPKCAGRWCPISEVIGGKPRDVYEVRLWNYGPRAWRVSAIDVKAQGFERTGMTEEVARRVYESIRDQTTIHTLLTRHGFRYQ